MSKDNKSFQEKFKQFFKQFKGSGIPRSKSDEYVVLTEELAAELKSDNSLSTRIRAVKELAELCKIRRAESHTIEKIWGLLSDMFRPEFPSETRHLIFGLFVTLCQCQLEKNGFLRSKFFTFIKSHELLEDADPRFQFLKALTENGRDVSYFDEKIGPLLLHWMAAPQIHSIRNAEFMSFLVNIIKFNQGFLDQDVLVGIIQNVCFISCTCTIKDDVLECLHVLGAVICYGSLPPGSLSTFLATLCRTVNVDALCQTSWKIMRNLLGTHLGHSGLFTMCNFMETVERSEDVAVIRGAIFFVGVVLWGSKMIRSLKYSTNTVLFSFNQALERRHSLITFEVMMRVQDLVKSNGDSLQAVSWDLVLQLIDKAVEQTKPKPHVVVVDPTYHQKIIKAVNESLDCIERIVDTGLFYGSIARFYKVIDSSCSFRSESSVDKLLLYKMKTQMRSTKHSWFNDLSVFADRHFKQESRSGLRVKALSYIAKVCLENRDSYEEDLIDKIILPHLKNLETENNSVVRQNGVKFIVEFLIESSSKKGHELLHILERIINRPFDMLAHASDTVHIFIESDVTDIHSAVGGLVQIFQRKIYHLPSSIAVATYNILVRHLTNHYKRPAVLETCSSIRYMIFDCFFRIRANAMYNLGFPDKVKPTVISYSPYLAVDYRDGEKLDGTEPAHPSASVTAVTGAANNSATPTSASHSSSSNATYQHRSSFSAAIVSVSCTTPSVTYISLTAACKLVVSSLKKEKDWKVLELVLQQIPHALENKALILSKHGNDIEYLATALCSMVPDKGQSLQLPESLRNTPMKFSRSDFHAYLFPILTALVSYHTYLESSVQLKIVKCLEYGLVSKCSRICILALSICTLEMQNTMLKLLPEVLLALSKISPKVNIAIPVLEFLSTLIHLPRVFASFVQDQYMSIFAIALPYTNPFKFNQYTVSLAHHVIAMWFLKCRLSFRRGFVSYIIKGLEANVWAPFEEETRRNNLELRNEDSSNRKRSSSLTEQSHKRRERPISGHGNMPPPASRAPHLDLKPTVNKALMTFHQELTETCVDLMARYAFADCSALPTRFSSTNFLLSGGHSQTWMMDNKIITITTSGCTQKELRDGLCDKCWLICRKQRSFEETSKNSSQEGGTPYSGTGRNVPMKNFGNVFSDSTANTGSTTSLAARRRHRSAFASAPVSTGQKKSEYSGTSSIGDATEKKEESKLAKDDLHLEHKLQLQHSVSDPTEEGEQSNSSLFYTDIAVKHKSESFLCTCWCQGWAEIHIRRPTGNTSWMMRIQNHIGNYTTSELPIKELASMYLQNVLDASHDESMASSGASSALSSPTHYPSNSFKSSPLVSQDSGAGPTSPKTPATPKSPDSPVELSETDLEQGKKNSVKRSNSSPEMSSSWKNPMMRRQGEIEEQDEDDPTLSTPTTPSEAQVDPLGAAGASPNISTSNPIKPTVKPISLKTSTEEIQSSVINDDNEKFKDSKTQSNSPPQIQQQQQQQPQLKGTTSPYRRSYEAIPEEHLQKIPEIQPQTVADSLSPLTRERMFTISVMSPARRNQGLRRIVSTGGESLSYTKTGETGIRSGISPSFVYLQLCAQGFFGQSPKPLLLPANQATEKSLKVLDYIPPYETHKIGVVYVGPDQVQNETAILHNQHGSTRYRDFLQGLGTLIKLKEIDPQKVYIGGLSKDGSDGEFACIWQDDVMQVIFHVATLMPNKTSDSLGTSKKLHIGNDFVAIVYNNSDEEYDISTIKGQFLYACVVIQPLDHRTNRVIVKAKPILADHIGHTESKIVSDQNLPIMARQLALHSNLASVIFQLMQRKGTDPYASNWLERLRHIKRLRNRLFQELGPPPGISEDQMDPFSTSPPIRPFNVDDFTDYV